MKKAFIIALCLHIIVFVALLISILFDFFKKDRDEVHVFALQTAPMERSDPTPPTPAPPAVDPTPTPPPPEPPPVPAPKVEKLKPKPKPKVEKPKPKPKVEKPKPKPKTEKPKPKPKPEKIDFSSFQQKVDIKETRERPDMNQQKTVTKPVKVDMPTMNTSSLRTNVSSIQVVQNSSTASVDPNVIARYGAQLRAKVQAVWENPGSSRLKVVLLITVDSRGNLSAVIDKGSGDGAFDSTALRAIRSIGRMAPPPKGSTKNGILVFRLPLERG